MFSHFLIVSLRVVLTAVSLKFILEEGIVHSSHFLSYLEIIFSKREKERVIHI